MLILAAMRGGSICSTRRIFHAILLRIGVRISTPGWLRVTIMVSAIRVGVLSCRSHSTGDVVRAVARTRGVQGGFLLLVLFEVNFILLVAQTRASLQDLEGNECEKSDTNYATDDTNGSDSTLVGTEAVITHIHGSGFRVYGLLPQETDLVLAAAASPV